LTRPVKPIATPAPPPPLTDQTCDLTAAAVKPPTPAEQRQDTDNDAAGSRKATHDLDELKERCGDDAGAGDRAKPSRDEPLTPAPRR